MKELDSCLNLRRKINDIDEKIKTLQAAILSPKNQVITGMPRGGNNSDNAIERYLVKLEKLQRLKDNLLSHQKSIWVDIEDKAKAANIPEQDIYLLYLRFVKGKKWNKCAVKMNKKYGNWNINKVFRIYRRTIDILSSSCTNNGHNVCEKCEL